MEFPDDFTTYPGTPVTTDYVLLNKYRATLAQLGTALGTQTVQAEWNRADLTQFGSANLIGTPVNPTITSTAVATGYGDVLRFTLGNGTTAGEGAAWFFNDTSDFGPYTIDMTISADLTNPVQPAESIVCGVLFGADATVGSGISLSMAINNGASCALGIGVQEAYASPGTGIVTQTVTGTGYWTIRFDSIAAGLADVAGFPPNGAPTFGGSATVTSIGSGTVTGTSFVVETTDWTAAIGASDTNRLGVFVIAGTNLSATTACNILSLRVRSNA